MNPHKVTKDFEVALAEYAGAPFAVTCTSCTMAIFLALQWHRHRYGPTSVVDIPKFTYVGVAQSALHAGCRIRWTDEEWQHRGWYVLTPTPVIDSARLLSSNVYEPGSLMCLSFHWSKHMGISAGGGAILTDDRDAVTFLRRARFDGRTPGVPAAEDTFQIGWHAYMAPEQAAEGLMRLAVLPRHNEPLPEPGYPDLSRQAVFAPHTEGYALKSAS